MLQLLNSLSIKTTTRTFVTSLCNDTIKIGVLVGCKRYCVLFGIFEVSSRTRSSIQLNRNIRVCWRLIVGRIETNTDRIAVDVLVIAILFGCDLLIIQTVINCIQDNSISFATLRISWFFHKDSKMAQLIFKRETDCLVCNYIRAKDLFVDLLIIHLMNICRKNNHVVLDILKYSDWWKEWILDIRDFVWIIHQILSCIHIINILTVCTVSKICIRDLDVIVCMEFKLIKEQWCSRSEDELTIDHVCP